MRPKYAVTEKILLIGAPGAGKSTAWLSIADWYQKTQTSGHFHVLDSDMAVSRMLPEGYPHLTNVTAYPVMAWEQYKAALTTIQGQVGPNDWLVVDLLDPTWEAVQAYYIRQVFHKDIDDFFLMARQELKGKNLKALDGWKDWPVINLMYKTWLNQAVFQTPCHVLAAAKVTSLNSDTDDQATKNLFGPFGVKPRGQKDTPYMFHTVLVLAQGNQGQHWVANTVKDRTRRYWTGETITNFGLQYLVQVAGWAVK